MKKLAIRLKVQLSDPSVCPLAVPTDQSQSNFASSSLHIRLCSTVVCLWQPYNITLPPPFSRWSGPISSLPKMLHPRARRRNPVAILLIVILSFGVLYFLFSGSDSRSAKRLRDLQHAASNALSPPSLPFRKSPSSQGRSKEPPQAPPVVHYYMNNITTTTDPVGNRESVLILTPLARFYPAYWENLLKLSYPHELISIGFILPRGREGNIANAALQEQMQKTQNNPKKAFKSITVLRQESDPPLASQSEHERHKLENQKARRAHMAAARNALLFSVIGPDTSWVLWLDSDIVESPPTLIQDLAAHDKPIIAANCMQRYYNKEKGAMDVRPYDFNNWQDSQAAQDLAKKMGPDEVLFEGYASIPTWRGLMGHLAGVDGDDNPKKIMDLDGVGGTSLLVKAEVHRAGAMFPPFPFYHLIETEGFAKMARRLGWKSYGLPNYFVSIYVLFLHLF
jgi:mannan polymerase complexes MNN9 subunit